MEETYKFISCEYTFFEVRSNSGVYIGVTKKIKFPGILAILTNDAYKTKPKYESHMIIDSLNVTIKNIAENMYFSKEAAREDKKKIIDVYRKHGEKIINGEKSLATKINYFEKYSNDKRYIECPCGGFFKIGQKQHQHSQAHLRWIRESEDNKQKMIDWNKTNSIYRNGRSRLKLAF